MHEEWVKAYAAENCPNATRANVRCEIVIPGTLRIKMIT